MAIDLDALAKELKADGFEERNVHVGVHVLTLLSESGASSLDVRPDGCVQLYFRDLGGYWWRALDIIRRHIEGA